MEDIPIASSHKNESPATVSTKQWLALFGAVLGAFMAILDIQITNASIGQIAGALSIPIDQSNNISTAYLIAELVCIPLTVWLTRILGLRRTILWSTGLFAIASLACSLSWNLTSMVIFRAFQGFAGAPLIPLAFSMVLYLPKERQMTGMALFGLTATFAPTVGPALGGWLTENFSWEYLFYINVLPAFIVFLLISRNLKDQRISIEALKKLDIFSVITLSGGLGFLEYVLENGSRYNWFSSSYIVVLSCVAFTCLLLFVINDLLCEHPFVNIRLLGERRFGLGCAGFFLLGVILYGTVFMIPLYLVQIQHYSALDVGTVFFWQGLPQLICMPLIPKLSKHIDDRLLVAVGYLVLAGSCFIDAYMSPDFSGPQMRTGMIIRGIGLPFAIVPLSSVIMHNVSKDNISDATSLSSVIRNLGGAFGIACITTLITTQGDSNSKLLSSRLSSTGVEGHQWLHDTMAILMQREGDIYNITKQAQVLLHDKLQTNGYIIAFNNVYFLLGIFMIGCALSMVFFFERKTKVSSIHE